ncbi:hypothetical protein ALC62_14528 [Cyphomyrmex costatus]|uniref:Uncharacterized protein n=1 Tax=Cyphomyrmex costatus TaxID=456900 RepID=A0A195C434_9HYME|nr:hypothetical protein ALC62_14528 [Cyphomyrmex costatus]
MQLRGLKSQRGLREKKVYVSSVNGECLSSVGDAEVTIRQARKHERHRSSTLCAPEVLRNVIYKLALSIYSSRTYRVTNASTVTASPNCPPGRYRVARVIPLRRYAAKHEIEIRFC